jgi:hypothetical protein
MFKPKPLLHHRAFFPMAPVALACSAPFQVLCMSHAETTAYHSFLSPPPAAPFQQASVCVHCMYHCVRSVHIAGSAPSSGATAPSGTAAAGTPKAASSASSGGSSKYAHVPPGVGVVPIREPDLLPEGDPDSTEGGGIIEVSAARVRDSMRRYR